MGSTTDKIKGRVKEAVGVITDNDRLKREGQTDQVVGEVKEAAEKVKDTVARVVEKVKDASAIPGERQDPVTTTLSGLPFRKPPCENPLHTETIGGLWIRGCHVSCYPQRT